MDVERVWNLMQFFGGKAKDGQYHVIKRWALQFGLGTAYKEVIERPGGGGQLLQVEGPRRSTNKQQRDRDLAQVAKTMWFPEWDWYMMGEAQDYIRGNAVARPARATSCSSKVGEVKKQYPE